MSLRKKIVYACLGLSTLVTLYLFLWDEAFVRTPIKQSDCPVNAGVAPDGTCGIYESAPSLALIIAGVIALIGFVLLVIEVRLRKKNSTK